MGDKLFKIGSICILFGIACMLQSQIYNVIRLIYDLGKWLPWIGIVLVGIGCYKEF